MTLRNASRHQSPSRRRTSLPTYRLSSCRRCARPTSYGPTGSSSSSAQTPPRSPAARRSGPRSAARQSNSSTGRPSTTSTCGTSSWPKPAPGRLSGGRTVQVRRSGEVACARTPPSSGRRRPPGRSTSRCQPSPPGSANTHGSRQNSSAAGRGGGSYHRGSATSTGSAETRVQVIRSSEIGGADPLHRARGRRGRCRCRTSASRRRRPRTTEPVQIARSSNAGPRRRGQRVRRPRPSRRGRRDTACPTTACQCRSSGSRARGAFRKNRWYRSPSSASQKSHTQDDARRSTRTSAGGVRRGGHPPIVPPSGAGIHADAAVRPGAVRRVAGGDVHLVAGDPQPVEPQRLRPGQLLRRERMGAAPTPAKAAPQACASSSSGTSKRPPA